MSITKLIHFKSVYLSYRIHIPTKMKSIPNLLIKTLRDENLTLAIAESITCGMAASKLSAYKGVSDVLKGSLVCYTAEFKTILLKVKPSTIETFSCESKEVTEEMAQNLTKIVNADIYVAVTGLASAGGSESPKKPVGSVFYSIVYNGHTSNIRKKFEGQPMQIKNKTCIELYKLVLSLIDKKMNLN